MLYSTTSLLWTLPLWAQRGGGGELLGLIIFILIVVFNVVKSMFEARSDEARKKAAGQMRAESDELEFVSQPSVTASKRRERPKSKPQTTLRTSPPSSTLSRAEPQPVRSSLSRELGIQGEGARFYADPGTLDTSRLVAPSVEPTVMPTLESMTGVYDIPAAVETGNQSSMLDLRRLLARPDGIRQAVILGEILKRPEY